MCIFRAMSTGLKMQYPEAVKENGKKYLKNSSCLPNQFNLCVVKTCMAQTGVCG